MHHFLVSNELAMEKSANHGLNEFIRQQRCVTVQLRQARGRLGPGGLQPGSMAVRNSDLLGQAKIPLRQS